MISRHSFSKKSAVKAASVLILFSCFSAPAFADDHGYVYDPVSVNQSAKIYDYDPDSQFLVNARLGYVTDVELKPGEEVQKIAAGNTVQWSVEKDSVAGTSHVYIKPLSDSVTNMIVNTNVRSYRLIVTTYNSDVYFIIKWNYPKDQEAEYHKMLAKKTADQKQALQNVIKSILRAKLINKHYVVTKNENVLEKYIPPAVFDDGRKTYIEIAPDNRQNMPIVFYFDEWDKKKLQLVNYRLKGNFMEIDRVMDQIKLVFSQKSYLVLRKDDEKNTVPAPDQITLNKQSNQDLAFQTVRAGKRQAKAVDFHEEAPVSLKDKIREKQEKKVLEKIKAAHPSDDTSLDRLAAILAEDDEKEAPSAPAPASKGGEGR